MSGVELEVAVPPWLSSWRSCDGSTPKIEPTSSAMSTTPPPTATGRPAPRRSSTLSLRRPDSQSITPPAAARRAKVLSTARMEEAIPRRVERNRLLIRGRRFRPVQGCLLSRQGLTLVTR